MKISIKVTLLSLAVLFLSTSLSAQSDKQIKKATDNAQEVATALNLDTETQQKIYDINVNTYAKLNEIKKEGLTKEEMKAKNKAEWKAARKEIRTLLGPDLAKEYKKYRKQINAENKEKKEMKKEKKARG